MDYLGRWPWYILSLELVALASFWPLDLPWRALRKGSQERSGQIHSQSRFPRRWGDREESPKAVWIERVFLTSQCTFNFRRMKK
jgi:hypothetical protein